MNMRLSVKLFTSFLSMATIVLIVGLLGYININSLDRRKTTIVETVPLVDAAMEMKLAVANDMRLVMELLSPDNEKDLDEFWGMHEVVVEDFKLYANAILNGADTKEGKIYAARDDKTIKIVKEAVLFYDNELGKRIEKIYKIMKGKFAEQKIEESDLLTLDRDADEVSKKMIRMLGEIENNSKSAVTNAVAEADRIGSAGKVQLISGIILGFILAIIVAAYITRAIALPVNAICKKLSDSSGVVASASREISSANQQLSEASNEQASSIEETSSSLEEMTGMVTNNVQNAEKSTQIADSVKDISLKGNEAMGELVRAIEEILASNEKIQALVKVIGEIGEKTAVIDEIVFQTKLLSFNASVEAERAGEHGRGFAVVAQEVGNLAQMSGKAAQEISTIVKESIKNAEAITSENKKKVEQGGTLVAENAKILSEISEYAKTVAENAKQILNASKDQASGITQINKAMSQLDKATQENASTSEEAASSSEELSSQAENLNQIVEDLNSLVTGKNSSREGEYTNTTAQKSVHTLNDFKKAKKEKQEIKPKVVKAVKRPVVAINAALNSSAPAEEAGWKQL